MRRLILLTAALLVSLSLHAQTAKNADDAFLDRFYAVKRFEEVAISPDGKRVAWIVAGGGAFAGAARITTGKHDQAGLAFSPPSEHPAFISHTPLPPGGQPAPHAKGRRADPTRAP